MNIGRLHPVLYCAAYTENSTTLTDLLTTIHQKVRVFCDYEVGVSVFYQKCKLSI